MMAIPTPASVNKIRRPSSVRLDGWGTSAAISRHAHNDQQPQDDPEDDKSAQVEFLPLNREYLRHLAHGSPFSTLALDRRNGPSRGRTGRPQKPDHRRGTAGSRA